MKQILIILLVLGFFSSCDSNASKYNNINTAQQLLNKYKSLWTKADIHNYTFVMKRSCFCPIEENTQILVSDDILIEAKYIPSNKLYNKEQLSYQRTINQYFSLIQEAIDKNVYKLTVEYNETYGYPEEIFIDRNKQIEDEEISYSITHFSSVSESNETVCTADYVPVCGTVAIECISAPCESIEETFSNRCTLNANPNASYLHDGECI